MSNNPLVALAQKAFGLGPLQITPKRKYTALLLAGIVDVVQATMLAPSTTLGAMSPIEWGVDIATTVLLVAILGWNWRLLAAFAIELVPTAAMFPTWTALIMTITAFADEKKPVAPPGALPGAQPTPLGPGASPAAGSPERFPGVYQKRSR